MQTQNTTDALSLLREVRLVEIKSRRLTDETMAGEYRSAFKGHGMSFAEVREYHVGDDVRSIDWNVTARTARPHVKLYEEERELTVMLLIDLSRSLDVGTRKRTERRLVGELAATLAFSALKNGDKVGAIFFTDHVEKFIPPAKSRRHVLRIVAELLSFRPEGHRTAIAPALEYLVRALRKRCIAFVLSDFMDNDDYSQQLSIAARKHDLLALHIYDPLQQSLPDVGLLRVRDAETGRQMLLDTSSRRQREQHIAWWTQHRQRLAERMQRAGVDVASLPTHQDYAAPLRRLLRRLAVVALVLLFPFSLHAQNVVEASLSGADILIGEQVDLKLSVKTDAANTVQFPEYPPQGEMVPGVEVIQASVVDTQRHNNGQRLELTRSYTITSFDSALYVLQPAVLIGSDTIQARSSVGLKVTSVPVDTLHPEQMRDAYGPVDVEFEWSWNILLMILGLVLSAAVGIVFFRRARRIKPRVRRYVLPEVPTPRAAAQGIFEQLRAEQPSSPDEMKQHYMRMTEALRNYIAETYKISALEMTSAEITDALMSLPDTERESLRDILETADLVKFARYEASLPEADRNLLQAVRFVEATSPAPTEPRKPRIVEEVEGGEAVLRRRRRTYAIAALCGVVALVMLVLLGVELYNVI